MQEQTLKIRAFKIYRTHFEGAGGIKQLFVIAYPVIISNASMAAMMLIDRWYLAHVSKSHMAAAMTGGLMVFACLSFFVGTINYTNALVAQYLGAGRKHNCSAAVVQSMVLVLLSIPVIGILSYLGPQFLSLFGHAPEQFRLEGIYFQILLWSGILVLMRVSLTGFFAGIGRTRVVMIANVVSLFVNAGSNYIFIFGGFGIPPLGIVGAGIGTSLGRLVGFLILLAVYLSAGNRKEFQTHKTWCFNPPVFRKLIRFGLPTGVDLMLNTGAFNIFVQLFHAYGATVAAAVTITFNWDMVAFIPMLGFNIATMSLVGRNVGAKRPELAKKAAYSGLKLAYVYAGGLVILFLLLPTQLAAVFAPESVADGYSEVLPLATVMIRLAAVYVLADATTLVFSGALRGAGDTKWVMYASIAIHWIMVCGVFIAVKILQIKPITVWFMFVLFVLSLGVTMFLRFHSNKWQKNPNVVY